jgi:hypothetical protein
MHPSLARTVVALVLFAVGAGATASTATAAPTVSASPTANLEPTGETVAVTGSEIPLTTGTPPGTGLYAAQLAIVDGTTYLANNANAKWVRRVPTVGSASQAKLEDDGSFSTSVEVVRTWGSGASAVDCAAADTDCFVASWPAHGNPSAANIIDAVAITFAPAADITATPVSGLDAAGETVTVTGAHIPLTTGTPAGMGLYAAQFAIVDGTTYLANSASAKWVRRTPTVGSASQAKLEDDGTFSTSVDVVGTWGAGASAVDCAAADTDCFVGSWPAHGNPSAANIIDSVAIAFAADAPGGGGGDAGGGGGSFGLSVSPTTGLGTAGPSTVTVSGSGYATSEPGIYLVYGPLAGRTNPNAYYAGSQWLHVGGGTLSSTGTFSTTLAVAPTYTDGDGRAVNCTVVQCYVQTMRAHGQADVNQDFAVPVSFGSTVATPPPAPSVPQAPALGAPGPAPATPTSARSSGPASAPKLGKLRVNRRGRASLTVSERSTVTFVLRRKVRGTWKVVKVVRVRSAGAATVRAKLPMRRAGRYRISIKAVSSETGKASRKVVKHVRVKAKHAKKAKHGKHRNHAKRG